MTSRIAEVNTKLCYVMREFPVLTHTTVVNELSAMKALGQHVHVFSLLRPSRGEERQERRVDLSQVTYCWEKRAPARSVLYANATILRRVGLSNYQRAFRLARTGGLLTSLRAFARLAHHAETLREEGVTHFHAHWATEAATVALVFSRLTDVPFSFTAHAYDIFRSPQLLDLKVREAKFVVTVSEYNKQFIVNQFAPDQASKLHVIYPLIDLKQFPFRAFPIERRLEIVTVARLTEYKGLIYLVEACRVLRDRGVDFFCRIVGQGEDRSLLEASIRSHDLDGQVKLLGALSHDAIPSMFDECGVFVLPCVVARNGDRDGMPLVLIEAMARGVPVVSSNVIGLPELVRVGCGFLVPPRDPEALADTLQHSYGLSRVAKLEMARAGRAVVEEFDYMKGGARLLALIRGTDVNASKPFLAGSAR